MTDQQKGKTMENLPKYDYIFNVDDWDHTYNDTHELEECQLYMAEPGTVVTAQTLTLGPKIYGAVIPVAFDDDGDLEECEVQWFKTKDEAAAASNRKPETT